MSEIDWAALAAPFAKNEIKHKPGRMNKKTGRKSPPMAFITARQVMNRLDTTAGIGPANWRDTYTETQRGVVCTLSIRIDDEWVGKSDIGTESDIEGDKGIYSDALKRAAVKWGVGRELYQEGTAYDDLANERPPAEYEPPRKEGLSGDAAKRVFSYATACGVESAAELLGILGIEKSAEWTGGEEAAIAAINEWADATSPAELPNMPPEALVEHP